MLRSEVLCLNFFPYRPSKFFFLILKQMSPSYIWNQFLLHISLSSFSSFSFWNQFLLHISIYNSFWNNFLLQFSLSNSSSFAVIFFTISRIYSPFILFDVQSRPFWLPRCKRYRICSCPLSFTLPHRLVIAFMITAIVDVIINIIDNLLGSSLLIFCYLR